MCAASSLTVQSAVTQALQRVREIEYERERESNLLKELQVALRAVCIPSLERKIIRPLAQTLRLVPDLEWSF